MKMNLSRFGHIVLGSLVLFAASSGVASAATAPQDISSLAKSIITIIDTVLVPLVIAIAFIVFIWGVYQYLIAGAANEEKRGEGQKHILYGLIGFFVIFSLWGLVNVLVGTFGFEGSTRPGLPKFNESQGTSNTFQGSFTDPYGLNGAQNDPYNLGKNPQDTSVTLPKP